MNCNNGNTNEFNCPFAPQMVFIPRSKAVVGLADSDVFCQMGKGDCAKGDQCEAQTTGNLDRSILGWGM